MSKIFLQELDLRLNPVTHHEPDYRLFLIHMLLHLRTLGAFISFENVYKTVSMHFDR